MGGLSYGENLLLAVEVQWPQAVLTVEADAISIRDTVGLLKIDLPKGQIIRLSSCRMVLMSGMQIEHCASNTHPLIIFRTYDLNAIVSSLENTGYRFDWGLPV